MKARLRIGKGGDPTPASPRKAAPPDASAGFAGWVKLAWVPVFLLFLTVRAFSGSPYYDLGGDQCKYLTLGRNFPFHTLWNDSLYLIHPPPLGWSIGLVALALPLVEAGWLATLIWAGLAFLAVRRYGQIHGLNTSGLLVGLLYLSLHYWAVVFDTHVSRLPILMFFTTVSLIAFERFLAEGGRRRLMLSLLANAACLFVSDQALAILPAQLVIFLTDRRRGRWRDLTLVLAGSGLAYLVWPLVRLGVYLAHDDYPAGIDGTVEALAAFPAKALIQPNFLANTSLHNAQFAFSPRPVELLGFGLMFVRLLFFGQSAGTVVVAGLLAAAAFVGMRRRDRSVLKLFALSAFFSFPVALAWPVWYGLPFLIPFSVLLGKGLGAIESGGPRDRWLSVALMLGCLGLGLMWLIPDRQGPARWYHPVGGSHLLFQRQPVTRGQEAMRWLRDLPGDVGVMGPIGLTPEIVFLTGKRVIALPFDPARLDALIREYRISILVLTDGELRSTGDRTRDWVTHRVVARHIIQHPERYRPIRRYREAYPAFHPPQTFLFFEVQDADGHPAPTG